MIKLYLYNLSRPVSTSSLTQSTMSVVPLVGVAERLAVVPAVAQSQSARHHDGPADGRPQPPHAAGRPEPQHRDHPRRLRV